MVLPWLAFIAYWALSARRVSRVKDREESGTRGRSATFLVGAALLFLPSALGVLDGRVLEPSAVLGVTGWTLTLLGLSFAIGARWSLGRNWSSRVVLKVDQQLVRGGPYALVRHPIYAGILVALTGTAIYSGQWSSMLALPFFAAGFLQKAHSEETLLEREFGAEYLAYGARTPMLVPRLTLHRPAKPAGSPPASGQARPGG